MKQMRSALAILLILVGCGDDSRPPMEDMGMADGGDMQTPDSSMEDGGTPDEGMDAMPDAADMGVPDVMADMMPDMPVEPGCDNGIQDGDETDVDCGGETCELRCDTAQECVVSLDCASGVCISNECQAPQCTDGIRNGSELGIDCGGGDCDGCSVGEACVEPEDCDSSGECREGFCQAAGCFDEMRGGTESDVDCGGVECAPCDAGQRCSLATDCASGTCTGGFCLTELCLNGTLDPGEVAVDCGGGGCPGCADGTACTDGAECLSGRCEGDICTSCTDGVQNGDETDVDCGGATCAGCTTGGACTMNSDCASNECDAGACLQGTRSCLDLLLGGSTTSGIYEIQPDPALPRRMVYCDMETDGGGWTLVGSSRTTAMDDVAGPYFDDLTTLTPENENLGVWDGMRALGLERMDIRFACRRSPTAATNTVDLSFYGNDWYDEITRSTDDGETCFADGISNTNDMDPFPERQNNLSGQRIPQGVLWNASAGFEGEDSCGATDFTVDFQAGGMDRTSDTDWGKDDPIGTTGFCGTTTTTGVYLIFVREALCSNGTLDPGEIEIDCGGSCRGCPDGTMCTTPSDCGSDRCDGGTCTSCFDGEQNGMELGVDCGAECIGCPGGTACTEGNECISGVCEDNLCTSLFYAESFDASDGGWTASGLWEWGEPASGAIATANSPPNVWITNRTGDYPNNSDETVTSGPIDLGTAGSDPVISFAINHQHESTFDETFLEVSVDGGMTFTRVEASAAGSSGWYEADDEGWQNSTGGRWERASTILAGTAGEADVRLRFHFVSDSSGMRDGFAFDDIIIAPATPDLQVEVVPSPDICSAALVRVTNIGSANVTRFDLEVTVDGGAPMTDSIMGLLAPGQTLERTIAGGTIAARAILEDDFDSSDNAASVMLNAALGAMYTETFEMGPGGWQAVGVNSSWEFGVPDDTDISTADSPENAWVTGLDSNYNNDERSFLVSPCFDFSGLASDPTFSFSQIFRLPSVGDHVFVEMTVDGGMTWSRLGTVGPTWYNAIEDWWDGESSSGAGIWRRAFQTMTGSAGQSGVRLRIVMESDASGTDEGFGVDDVLIRP